MAFSDRFALAVRRLRALPRKAKITLAVGFVLIVLAVIGAVIITVGSREETPAPQTPVPSAVPLFSAATPVPTAESEDPAEDPTLLPQTADAGRTYLDETLFIGDSNTARYMMYADETGTAFTTLKNNIGVVSMGAQAITTLKCEQFKEYSGMYTIPDAVAMLKPRRIVICFGTNNLYGSSTDATNFISNYLKGLQAIETAWPYADIIVSAIPPLDKQRDNTNLTMTQVDAYNAAILQMCEENGYKFLNTAEVLKDESTGWAKKDYTLSDGVHLSKVAVTAVFNYVRTHAYLTEDRRPQPLGSIPTPEGPPVNLISQDPIAVRGAKVPVEFVASNGGTIQGSTSQMVKKGGTAASVTAVPNEGFRFTGWSASLGSVAQTETISFVVPGDANAGGVVLTAHFTPDEHDHDYAEIEGTRTNPTCLKVGVAKYECSICGEIVEKELAALGHQWDNGTLSADKLKKIYHCTRTGCSGVKEELLATPSPSPSPTPTTAPTHTPSATGTPSPTGTPVPQVTSSPTPMPTTTPTAAPAETPHVCDLVEDSRVEPTCGQAGSITYTCICGASRTDPVAATGAHSWDGGVRTEPQVGIPGNIHYTCTVCGAGYDESIPALDPPASEPAADPVTE